jgi:hypothetical protein
VEEVDDVVDQFLRQTRLGWVGGTGVPDNVGSEAEVVSDILMTNRSG